MAYNLPYKGFFIYEKDGEYTVGGANNTAFDDCTLENLECGTDETAMVNWNKNSGNKLLFWEMRNTEWVSEERYNEHLRRIQQMERDDILFHDGEFVVPCVRFADKERAKAFVDWLVQCQRYRYDAFAADTSEVISDEVDEEFCRFKKEVAANGYTGGKYFEESDYESSYNQTEITASQLYLAAKITEYLHTYYPNKYIASLGWAVSVSPVI